jgi:hypothetical protein
MAGPVDLSRVPKIAPGPAQTYGGKDSCSGRSREARTFGTRVICACGRCGHNRSESSCADPARRVPVFIETRDSHALARLSGVDEAPPADVDPVVAEVIEKDKVARLEPVARDGLAVPVLLRGVVRKRDADLPIDIPNQTRTVEARRARPAPSIGRTDMLPGNLDDPPAAGRGEPIDNIALTSRRRLDLGRGRAVARRRPR